MNAPLSAQYSKRRGKRVSKFLSLTQDFIAFVACYADETGVCFSAAVERLTRRGLLYQENDKNALLMTNGSPELKRIYTIMTMLPDTRENRYGKTSRKHISLTEDAIATVEAYARRHDLNFSVAVETLTLIGAGHRSAESLPRMAAEMLENVVARYFERQTRLSALALMAAEEANFKADFLVLQTLWREARLDPEDFVGNMTVSLQPDEEPDARARQLLSEIKALAQAGGLKRLKESPAPLLEPTYEGATDE